MCRLAAYSGPPLLLKRLLLDPEHSLMKQSWAAREMDGAALNADGFGFGWHTRDGHSAVYSSIFPIWNDRNLEGLGHALNAGQWFANVRSTPGAQPLASGRMLFQHNGSLNGFRNGLRDRFHQWLRPDIRAGMRGSSDSEYLFAVFRQSVNDEAGDVGAGLLQNIRVLHALLEGTEAAYNVIAGDGECLIACRHAFNRGACPSLYFSTSHERFPDGVVIASEPLDDSPAWQAVQPHSLLVVRNGAAMQRFNLAAHA